MAKTSSIYARVEPELKKQAERVLEQLEIPMSYAVSMFLKQIVLQQGIPFEMKLPGRRPVDMSMLTDEELGVEIEKGWNAIEEGRVYSADAIEEELKREYGL
jgi:addiction module RelB/DinJ family antitoxin